MATKKKSARRPRAAAPERKPLLGALLRLAHESVAEHVAQGLVSFGFDDLPPDYVTGHKLFWPGGELMGLGLYDYPLIDFVLEAFIAAGGWWLVRRRSTPRWATGWLVLAALLVVQGTLDAVGARRRGMKPSACARAEPLVLR